MRRAPLALLAAVTLSGAATNAACSSDPELRLAQPQRQIAENAASDGDVRREIPSRVQTRMPANVRHHWTEAKTAQAQTGCARYGRSHATATAGQVEC